MCIELHGRLPLEEIGRLGREALARGRDPAARPLQAGLRGSVALGLAAGPLTRLNGATARNWPPGLIRPPGAVAEQEFLARCVKCCECVRVCPTNAIQPAGFEFGMGGALDAHDELPHRDKRLPAQLHRVRPRLSDRGDQAPLPPGKAGRRIGRRTPVRLGLASVDRGRCLPWATGRPCIVCEETCPVSPKAITVEEVDQQRPDGTSVHLQRPVVDPARCIGCGVCEHECPLSGMRAIRVVADNESRQSEHAVLLRHEN